MDTLGLSEMFKDLKGEEAQFAIEALSNIMAVASQSLSKDELIMLTGALLTVIKHPEVIAEIKDLSVFEIIKEMKEGLAGA